MSKTISAFNITWRNVHNLFYNNNNNRKKINSSNVNFETANKFLSKDLDLRMWAFMLDKSL